MSERDQLIWMAGFFDGEGCVSLGRTHRVRPNSRSGWQYNLQAIIAHKSKEPLDLFHSRFGGGMYAYRLKGVEYWRWNVWGPKAAAMLVQLLPYLIVKRPITEVGLRFQEQMTAWNKELGRTGYPDHVIVGREAFYQEARALNAKQRVNNRAPKYEGPKAIAAQSA